MIKRIFTAVMLFSLIIFAAQDVFAAPNINYSVHVQNIGWMDYVGNDKVAGTTGKGLRMEAIVINCDGIEYRAHVQNEGWQGWVGSGQVAGTTGEDLRMEAVRIRLRGGLADRYDVYYRAYVQDRGWQSWVSNGEVAGSTGKNRRIEAIQIRLTKKGSDYDRYDDNYDDGYYNDDNYRRDRRDRRRW